MNKKHTILLLGITNTIIGMDSFRSFSKVPIVKCLFERHGTPRTLCQKTLFQYLVSERVKYSWKNKYGCSEEDIDTYRRLNVKTVAENWDFISCQTDVFLTEILNQVEALRDPYENSTSDGKYDPLTILYYFSWPLHVSVYMSVLRDKGERLSVLEGRFVKKWWAFDVNMALSLDKTRNSPEHYPLHYEHGSLVNSQERPPIVLYSDHLPKKMSIEVRQRYKNMSELDEVLKKYKSMLERE